MILETEIENKTDNELVELILKDQDNFLYLIKRYKLKLYNFIRRISNFGEEEIEDILQNVFIKVCMNLNDFDGNLKFSSWIYRIARNETIDHHRRNMARPKTVELKIGDDCVENFIHDFNVEQEFDKQILKKEINKSLDALDLKYKEILVLKYIEEKDYNEISDIIKKPLGTVASRLNKAKIELKKTLDKKFQRID